MKPQTTPDSRIYFNLTNDQIKLMNVLLINGWRMHSYPDEVLKGKLRFVKDKMQVKFDYINIIIIDKYGFGILSFTDINHLPNGKLRDVLKLEI